MRQDQTIQVLDGCVTYALEASFVLAAKDKQSLTVMTSFVKSIAVGEFSLSRLNASKTTYPFVPPIPKPLTLMRRLVWVVGQGASFIGITIFHSSSRITGGAFEK